MVVLVAVVLAFTSQSLRTFQQKNEENDKRQQILRSINVTVPANEAEAKYSELIKEAFLVNENGEKVEGDAFAAVVDVKFKEQLKGVTEGYKDSLSTIQLTSYEPNRLVYKASTPKDGVVVFSEIYYPGWQVNIDGQPVDIARADYILRAINMPAGEHTIEMWFDPQSIHVTESIAYAALALLLIGVMVLAWTQRSKIAKKS